MSKPAETNKGKPLLVIGFILMMLGFMAFLNPILLLLFMPIPYSYTGQIGVVYMFLGAALTVDGVLMKWRTADGVMLKWRISGKQVLGLVLMYVGAFVLCGAVSAFYYTEFVP